MHVHLTLFALAGCAGGAAGGGDSGEPPDLPPGVELGTGDVEFEPLEDGDAIDIVFGPQGGYHFYTSILVQGIDCGDNLDLDDPDNPVTAFYAWKDGARIDRDEATYKQGLDPVPDQPGVFSMIGRRLILDIQKDDELDGAEVKITVDVTDHTGATVHDERTLIAQPSPFNPPEAR